MNNYLYRIKKRTTDKCTACPQKKDDSFHILFECRAWASEREKLRLNLDITQFPLSFDKIIEKTLQNKSNWLAFIQFSNKVMHSKEQLERKKEEEARGALPTSASFLAND